MNTEIQKALEQIAMEESLLIAERGGLDYRGSDSEDFLDISVWTLRVMLARAYELGKAEH
jgi:hypothetical protein